MIINDLKVNGLTKPVGYDYNDGLTFSFKTDTRFESSKLIIATDEKLKNIVYEVDNKNNSLYFFVNIKLMPRTIYYWAIKIGNETSEVSTFETSKIDEKWTGYYISSKDIYGHPVFYKTFNLEKLPNSARLYIIGLGLYNAKINGLDVTDSLFNPHQTQYDKWAEYQTYDVSNLFKLGENIIEVCLGRGWYMGGFGFNPVKNYFGDSFTLLSELHLYFDDSHLVIPSDLSWRARSSHIIESGIYYGEDVDMTMKIKDIPLFKNDKINFDLKPSHAIPVKKKIELEPELIIDANNDYLLDFKQNMTGFVKFDVDMKCGEKIVLDCAEILQDNCFYNKNYREARSTFSYISDGIRRSVEPLFSFFGFRYIRVRGIKNINPKDFKAVVIHSDFELDGFIETNNKKINRLILNAIWGIRGNSLDIPTDCPQRSERMGWTGDLQAISKTAMYLFNIYPFYDKWMYESLMDQKEDGSITDIIPPIKECNKNACGWSDASIIVPYNYYLFTGDKRILYRQYSTMKKFIKKLESLYDDGYRDRNTRNYGDWLALDNIDAINDPDCPDGYTDFSFLCDAYFIYSISLLLEISRILSYREDTDYLEKLLYKQKRLFKINYLDNPIDKYETQTAFALILGMNLSDNKEYYSIKLYEKMKKDNFVLKTGFIGTIFILDALMDINKEELVMDLLLKEEYPSWLYCVNLGATTIWERWNSLMPDGSANKGGMNSYNHYAYGMVIGFMMSRIVGIKPVIDNAGFKNVLIAPYASKKLKDVFGYTNTPYGKYIVEYHVSNESIKYIVTVPTNGTAEFVLKDKKTIDVLKGDGFIETNEGIKTILSEGTYEYIIR